MKLSARNVLDGTVLDGTVLEVTRDATTSHIKIDVGNGIVITASITNEAVDELRLVNLLIAAASSPLIVGTR